jgi:hypothetical protein
MPATETAATTPAEHSHATLGAVGHWYVLAVSSTAWSTEFTVAAPPAPEVDLLAGERLRWEDVRASAVYGSVRSWDEVDLGVEEDE